MPQHEHLPSTSTGPGRFPRVTSPLLGRARESRNVGGLLKQGDVALLTLIGPGGVGKTRLALEVAGEVEGHFEDGVVFVPLAGVRDSALVPDAIARALGVDPAGQGALVALGRYLRSRSLLLLVDNFEHLLDASVILAELLQDAPGLRVLVTSRAPLRLTAEHVYPLSPLALPEVDPRHAASFTGTLEDETAAVQLFVTRARAALPSFTLDGHNVRGVRELVRRLDGLPLALELAAARVREVPPASMLARLDRLLPVLSRGPRDLPARQQTLRATVQWSYDLLTPGEQVLLRRLSVFAGGWTLEAAEAVCVPGPDEDVLDMLSMLVEHSLVQRSDRGPDVRYGMLETVREFAADQLREAAENLTTSDLHAAYFERFAGDADRAVRGREQVRWIGRVEAEAENVEQAVAFLLAQGDLDRAAALIWHLMLYSWWASRTVEGQRRAEAVLEAARTGRALSTEGRARALTVGGTMAFWMSDLDGALTRLEEAVRLFAELGDTPPMPLLKFGLTLALHGETERALGLIEQGAESCGKLQDEWLLSASFIARGTVAVVAGDAPGTLAHHLQAFERAQARGDEIVEAMALLGLAYVAVQERQFENAGAQLLRAGELCLRLRYANGVAMALEGWLTLALARGETHVAAELFGSAQALREAIRVPSWTEGTFVPERIEPQLVRAVGHEEFTRLRARGRLLSPDDALALGARITSTGHEPRSAPAGSLTDLTERERMVLRLLASGLTNVAVAAELGISRHTVDAHVKSIFSKLGVTTRVAATRRALDLGLTGGDAG